MEQVLKHLSRHKVRPGDSVMFDIDDTLINSKTNEPIPHIVNLLKVCKELGHNIVIITARSGDEWVQTHTEKQLADIGVTYDFLGYCNAEVKTLLKQHLRDTRGWYFILSVGDMPTDLTDSDIYLLVK